MTSKIKQWLNSWKHYLEGRVLEVGSLNVNGSARDVVPIAVGIDMRKGTGVDMVLSVVDLPQHFPPGHFDACISTETLEHVEDWKAFITNTWDAVKDGGYLVMTMASRSKGRHAYPDDYWRFSLDDIKLIYPRAEWVGNLGPVSIGWVVKKEGERPNLDVKPFIVP